MSEHHLHRYVTEFDFKYNHRDTTDGERACAIAQAAEGKRLMFRETRTDKSR